MDGQTIYNSSTTLALRALCSKKPESVILVYCVSGRRRKMANQDVKNICDELHSKIAQNVSPDLVMDNLLSKKVISGDDYGRLCQVTFSRDRCRDLLSLLYGSTHPQAFIYLRLALLDEYSWIVDEIDQQIPSLTSQLQQLKLSQAGDGKLSTSQVMNIVYL